MSDLDRKAIAILRGAPDTDPASLDAYISQHCETDPVLAERVRALLSKVRGNAAIDPVDPSGPSRTGSVVAHRYRLLERLGVGGMGEVYRAERVDGDFRQEVALKLVHGGFAGLFERFGRERRILARLTHPNIAHLIDGGVDGDGTPWLAMEYVDGERITNWCDARQLRPGARVDLMLRICDAIGFAHRNLVVHRDIKPANVLVADDGTPKLLDFGIARLLDAGDADATQTLAMTPAYAAPEQRRGEAVTTATDVYQLGLVLYELLAGTSRHQARRHGHPSTTEPDSAPSMACAYDAIAAGDDTAAMRIARARDLSPERLRVVLKGDLGRIVGKALSDAPTDRYGSARELADDLQRWRSDRPILARRESAFYRARKFIRRHRAAAVFAGVAVLSLGTAVVGMAWKTAEASREAERANAVQDFLLGLFENNAPTSMRDELPTTRELLDAGVERIRSGFADQPDTRADLLAAVGRIYLQQAHHESAEPLLTEALALRESLYGANHPQVLSSLFDSIKLAVETDRLDEARVLLDRALPMAIASDDPELRTELHLASAIVLFREGQWQASADDARIAVEQLESADAPGIALVAPAYAQLAASLRRLARIDEAVVVSQAGIDRVRQLHGERHYDELMLYTGIVLGLRGAERYEDAARYGREAVALSEAIFDGAHPEFANNLFSLGATLALRGDPVEAEQLLRRSVAMFEQVFGPTLNLSGSEMMYARLNLATLLTRMGRLQESEAMLLAVIAELEAHPELRELQATHAEVWIYLALPLMLRGEFNEARQWLDRALAVFDTPDNAGRYATLISRARTYLAQIEIAQAQPASAVEQARLGLNAIESVAGGAQRPAAIVRLQLGRALVDTGDIAGATEQLDSALQSFLRLGGEGSPETIEARLELARALTIAGDASTAADQIAAARLGASALPASHPLHARIAALG